MALRDITKRALAAAAFMAVAVGAGLTPAGAQDADSSADQASSSFGIRAGEFGRTTLEDDHFTYDVPAGSTVEDSVILINHTTAPLQLRLYPADLISAEGGGFAPAQPGVPSNGFGGWARVEASTVDLAPSESKEIRFTVDVPDQARPGEHLGAIVASTTADRGSAALAVETRAALIAKVRVPGTLAPDLNLSRLTATTDDDGARTFSVTVTNPGNVLLEVPGHVDVESGGRRIARLPLTPTDTYVIPGGKTTLTARWENPPLVGRAVAHAVIAAELDDKTTETYRTPLLEIVLVSWLLLGLAAAGVVVLVLGWILLRQRARRRRDERLRHAELLEQVSVLLAEKSSAKAEPVNPPTRAEARPPRRREPRAANVPRAHRSPRRRSGSAPR